MPACGVDGRLCPDCASYRPPEPEPERPSKPMSTKIKLKLGVVANGIFIPALTKLCNLNHHSGRDTYALVRTLDGLSPELDSYSKTKESLLKKHGAVSNLAALQSSLLKLGDGLAETDARNRLTQEIAKLAPFEQLQLTPADAGYAPFMAELKTVNETEVELYLDHKVPLALDKLDGVFTPFELKELAAAVVDVKE